MSKRTLALRQGRPEAHRCVGNHG